MLLRLMAPILSFTAEEAWETLHPAPGGPGQYSDSVFLHTWNDVLPSQEGEAALAARWKRIRELRALVVKRLEEARTAGGIGSSLQAEVELAVPAADRDLLASLGDDLKFVLITSAAAVKEGAEAAVEVRPSRHAKCERCWHWRADVGADRRHATICGRCVVNLEGPGEERIHA
jgi:isoleucyl-tRNA synthetase